MRVRSTPPSPEVPLSPEPVELRWPETPPHAPRLHAPLGRPLRLRSPPSGQRLRGTRCRCRAECLWPQTGDHGASPGRVPAATPSQAGAPREAGASPRRPPPAGHVGQSFGRPPWPLPPSHRQPAALSACAPLRLRRAPGSPIQTDNAPRLLDRPMAKVGRGQASGGGAK